MVHKSILPLDAFNRDWAVVTSRRGGWLRDRNGNVLFDWGYVPSLTDVFEVCERMIEEYDKWQRL